MLPNYRSMPGVWLPQSALALPALASFFQKLRPDLRNSFFGIRTLPFSVFHRFFSSNSDEHSDTFPNGSSKNTTDRKKKDSLKNAGATDQLLAKQKVLKLPQKGKAVKQKSEDFMATEGSLYDQIIALQKKYATHVVLLRVGDFYELYGIQAEEIGGLLDLTVTSKILSGRKIPMAGFPTVSYDTYMARLMKKGKTVAVIEQVHPPSSKKRPALLKRECVRIVTPGTLVTETYLGSSANNFLLAISMDQSNEFGADFPIGLSWANLSTGKVMTKLSSYEDLPGDLERIQPVEILIPNEVLNHGKSDESRRHPILNIINGTLGMDVLLVPREEEGMITKQNLDHLIQKFSTECRLSPLPADSHSIPTPSSNEQVSDDGGAVVARSLCMMFSYIDYTLFRSKPLLHRPTVLGNNDYMYLDDTSYKQLEIHKTFLRGSKVGSLAGFLNVAKTPMGAREINERVGLPATNLNVIQKRHDYVEYFYRNHLLVAKLEKELKEVTDVERDLQKMSIGVANHKDTYSLYHTIQKFGLIRGMLDNHLSDVDRGNNESNQSSLRLLMNELYDHSSLILELSTKLHLDDATMTLDNMPQELMDPRQRIIRKGYFIPGFIQLFPTHLSIDDSKHSVDLKLDQIYERYYDALHRLQASKEILTSDFELKSAKFSLRPTEGPVIELSKTDSKKLSDYVKNMKNPEDWRCVKNHKTKQLWWYKKWAEYVDELLAISSEISEYETTMLRQLQQLILDHRKEIEKSAKAIAELDIASSFAKLAVEHGFPNMGGKSTFLKQVALIHIMAQIGCFVPAEDASLGIVDAIYTRVSQIYIHYCNFLLPQSHAILLHLFRNNDDTGSWARMTICDLSTFAIEMKDLAKMISHATPKSLLIIDELGRGTSVEDGTALSLSIIQHLVTYINCRILVSSHQHDISWLIPKVLNDITHRRVQFWHTKPVEMEKGLTMDYELRRGPAESSFGIEIAKSAGLSSEITENAIAFRELVKGGRIGKSVVSEDLVR
ncbi:DNA mismatch repair protein MutS [Paraphysoderma sedebokerense]|nr:DNA mismatch repair protein MutS [Paraphysoderma sedebokerense]